MSYRCQAAVLHHPGQSLRLQEIELADPRPGEVLVRTMAAGICGTDLHFATGTVPYPLPTVLGHEASGIVEAIGENVTGIAPGDRVIVCDQTFCGHCPACLSGAMVYCTDTTGKQRQRHRLTLDGAPFRQYLGVSAFAELMLLDARALIPLPDDVSFGAGALLSCCITTGLAAVFNVSRPEPGSRVAVIGTGGVGLSAVQAARIAGAAQIIAADLEDHRLALASELGATDTVRAGAGDDLAEKITELSGGGVDRSIEAVGLPHTASTAFRALAPQGHATIVGMMPPGADVPVPGRLLRHGRTLAGTVMGSVRTLADIPRYTALLHNQQLRAEPLVTSVLPLAQIDEALQRAQARHGARTLVSF
ncbi:zinc-binding dehydrogenase [Streptomyces sp. NPDC051173]|uniref:zinc-binding dehydrogenase n=1 Tax=Streptomyces sp. NPDC051173 TaxID=3155164 RepID=UPI00344D1DA3